MTFAVQVEPASDPPGAVEYRWDPDTDILTATLSATSPGTGMSGSVELTGKDGSWVVLGVSAGRIDGVEVAVWPDVRKVPVLQPPAEVEEARVVLPARRTQPNIAAVEVDSALLAEADQAERTIHFKVGMHRPARVLRLARDLLLEVDQRGVIAGLWLLNVPPFPTDA